MATEEGRELDREARAHMVLAALLRKQRPPAKREEVRRILQSELTTGRIIEAIKRLDSQPEGETAGPKDAENGRQAGREEPAGPEAQAEEPRPGRGPTPFRLAIPKLKSILKLPRVRTPFFRYVFREFPRIALFGRVTHVFAPVFLFPVLRLEARIPRLFVESLIPWANELLSLLDPLLLIGWKHLEKREYNMIVALDRLCREISAVNFRLLNLRDRSLIDKLRILETLFFAFHYQSDSAAEVAKAIERSMSREPELSPRAERAALLANKLLQPELTIPSLYNLLVGLNLMKYRKALTLPDLLSPDLGELFETERYACDPAIEAKIKATVDELKTKIVKLNREWSSLKRFKELLNMADSEAPAYLELAALYDYGSSPLQTSSFEADRANVMDFAPNFFRAFESSCYPLLGGGIRLEGGARVEIFSVGAFQNELDRIRLTASKLERASFGFRSFPYSRYASIKREGKGGISTELEVVVRLEEATAALVSIGKKLERVAASAKRSRAEIGAEEERMRPAQPIEGLAPAGGRPVTLPHRSQSIAAGSWLGGKSVEHAVAAVAAVCLQCAFYLCDQGFIQTIASERATYQQMNGHLGTVRRLADAQVYDQLVTVLLQTG